MRLAILLAGSAILAASCIDMKEGLACSSDADCLGYLCRANVCVGSEELEGTDGGTHIGVEVLVDGQPNPDAIALDETSVYWANVDRTGRKDLEVMRVSKSGGSATTLFTAPAAPPYSASLVVSDGYLYCAYGQNVFRVPVEGGTRETIFRNTDAFVKFTGGIAADPTSIYAGFTGKILKVSKDGATSTTLAPGLRSGEEPTALALAGSRLWWTSTIGRVWRVPVVGGNASQLPTEGAFGITTDGTNVYWACSAGGGNQDICWLPADSGDGLQLSIGSAISALAPDGSNIFWTGPGGGLFSRPVSGGETRVLVRAGDRYGSGASVAVDAGFVYWTQGDRVMRLAK